jgi:hypothetical protein
MRWSRREIEVERRMVTVDCPWCEGPAVVEMMAETTELRCDDCSVAVEVAGERTSALPLAA